MFLTQVDEQTVQRHPEQAHARVHNTVDQANGVWKAGRTFYEVIVNILEFL
jgi:hypothetical protein